jgi:hypothetical protein
MAGLPLDQWAEETGWAAKWEARGKAEGEKTGWKKALEMLKQGHTVEELERMSSSPQQEEAGRIGETT